MNTLPAPMFISEDFLHRTRFLWHGNNPPMYFTVTAGKKSAPKCLAWYTRVICIRWGVQRVKKEPWNQTPVPHQQSWDTTQHFIPLAICFSFVSPLSSGYVQLEIPASINHPFAWPFMHSSSTTKRMHLLQMKMHRGWSVEQFKPEWLT